MDSVFPTLISFVYPLLGIFKVVVAIIASQNYKTSGTGMMIAGALIGMAVSLAYPMVNLVNNFFYNSHEVIFMSLSVFGLIASVLFIVGLLLTVNHIVDRKASVGT